MPYLCPQRSTKLLPALVFSLAAWSAARAAVWEDPLWALSAKADVTAGYDSNLFGIDGGPGDDFATYRPSLLLSLKDSPITLDTEAWVSWTTFDRETGNDSIDPGVRMTLAFPANAPDTVPTQTAEVHWIRSTSLNVDIGGRVSQDDAQASYAGNLVNTGKLVVDGRADLDRDEYLGSAYTTVDTGTVGTTVSYSPQELFKAGVGYDLTVGRSVPNAGGAGTLDRTEHAFTAQAGGEFGPEVTGSVAAGAAYSDYTGYFAYSEWDTIATADLVWKPRERLSLDLKASRAPSFNADGNVDLDSTIGLTIRQELPRGFAVHADGMVGRAAHERVVTYRTDDLEGGGGGLDYNLTGKLLVSLSYDWTHQDSDVYPFTYQRHVVTGEVQYSF
jgi:Putative beta-barrel porin 2